MAETEILGEKVDAFKQGDLGIKAYAYDPDNPSGPPPSEVVHIKSASFVSKRGQKTSLGHVLLVQAGLSLKFVVGTSFKNRLGFGLKVELPASELVHELFVPAIPESVKKGWVYMPSPLDRDDAGKAFEVKYALDMKDELNIADFRERTRLTLTAWPITRWELAGSIYADDEPLKTVGRSAPTGRLAGLVEGRSLGLTTNLRHARIHSADWEARQSIDLQLMATDRPASEIAIGPA